MNRPIILPEPGPLLAGRQIGVGAARGTFGELLQGALPDEDADFLVTLPIMCYAYATFRSEPSAQELEVWPVHKSKSLHLATALLAHYGLPPGGQLVLNSELPEGKGMASSSADLVATARAIESCFGLVLPLTLLQSLMREIEPSDGVMYPEIVVFYHRLVRLREILCSPPPMAIVAIDEGGIIDTITFNKRPKLYAESDKLEYAYLLSQIQSAFKRQDLSRVGQIATRSALLNQRLNPKRTLDRVIKITSQVGGLGVVVAHSGTCLGILFDSRDRLHCWQVEQAKAALRWLSDTIYYYTTTDYKGEFHEIQSP